VNIVPLVHLTGSDSPIFHKINKFTGITHLEGIDPIDASAVAWLFQQRDVLEMTDTRGDTPSISGVRRRRVVYVIHICQTNCGVDIIHVIFVAPFSDVTLQSKILGIVVSFVSIDAVPPKELCALVKLVAGKEDETAISARHVLDGLQTEDGYISTRAYEAVTKSASKSVCTIFNHSRTEAELESFAI